VKYFTLKVFHKVFRLKGCLVNGQLHYKNALNMVKWINP